jgi:4-amino-4-deoxy-L-arabinose transferase-like glycosyltransferase
LVVFNDSLAEDSFAMVGSNTTAGSAPAGLGGLLHAIAQQPHHAFAVFLAIHVVLWTVVPAVLCSSLPLDVIEGIAFGRDWQLGYWKHPPLTWWVADLTRRVSGGQPWAFFLISQLSVAVCFWALWRLGREFLSPLEALVAVVLLDGCIVFNVRTIEFNHNIMQLPFLALAGWSLYRAFVGERLRDWLLVGLWFALAFYAKYEAVVLLIPALLFAIVDPQARRCWKGFGPYLAAAVCAVLFAPHAIWSMLHDFTTVQFFNHRASQHQSLTAMLYGFLEFPVNAVLLIVPIWPLFSILYGRWDWGLHPAVATAEQRFARRYVTVLAYGPLLTAVAASLAMRRSFPSIWAMQLWCFYTLHLMAVWRPQVHREALGRLFKAWLGLTAIWIAVQVAAQTFLVAPPRLFGTQFPGAQLSALVTDAWRKETDRPLRYIVSEFWAAGNVILFARDPPYLFDEADLRRTPAIDPQDVRRSGAVILLPPQVGRDRQLPPSAPPRWMAQFPNAEPREPFVLRRQTPRGEITWTIGWAYLPPASR